MRIRKPFRSLFSRLLLALLILLTLFAVFSLWLTQRSSKNYFYEFNQRLNAPIAMYVASNYRLIQDNTLDHEKLEELAERVMIINPSLDVFLLDAFGNVIGQANSANPVAQSKVSLEPIIQFMNVSDDTNSQPTNGIADIFLPTYPIFGDNPRHAGLKSVFSVHPITEDEKPVGYVYAVLSGPTHRNLFESMVVNYSVTSAVFITLAILLFTILGGAIIFFILTDRLRTLSKRVNQWQEHYTELEKGVDNNFAYKDYTALSSFSNNELVIESDTDEIGRLTSSYENMMARLSQQLFELKRADENRRELFASISHDLRTPLTSMQGYLETIHHRYQHLDTTKKRRYLSIALRQSERLRSLIDNVLELSKLHSGEMTLYPEKFCILELVHDCAQDFAIEARQRNIQLHVLPKSVKDQSFHVFADLAMIHRVLENMLVNALRFTPKNGQIFVHVHIRKKEAISVTIIDTGVGMSSDEIGRAFNARYTNNNKTKLTHKMHYAGQGLGLAIAKAVIELHGENIVLVSKLSKGSSFTFSLPAA